MGKSVTNGFKLDSTKKAKWVNALKSGDYEQGKNKLKINGWGSEEDRYCCLGVANEIKLCKQRTDGTEFISEKFLPDEIQQHLSIYNDNGKSFRWIAGWINRYL